MVSDEFAGDDKLCVIHHCLDVFAVEPFGMTLRYNKIPQFLARVK